MSNDIWNKDICKGFQAGLKHAAERAMNCYEPVGSDDYQRGFGEAKRAIEQAILKEAND